MKVGIVSRFPPQESGIGVTSQQYYEALDRKEDVEPLKISSSSSADIKIDFTSWRLPLEIRRAVKQNDIDLLHIQHFHEMFKYRGASLTFAGVPVLTEMHEPSHNLPYNWFSIQSRIHKWMQDFLIKNSEEVTVHLEKNQQLLPDKVRKIPMGVENRDVQDTEPEAETLLAFGFLREGKGAAIAAESSGHHDKKIIIAGSSKHNPDYSKKVEKIAKDNPQIKFDCRWISSEEKDEYFRNSDIILAPYTHQNSDSGILRDAISYETPLITSKQPVFREEVEKYNIGILVEPTPENIGEAVKEAERNYRELVENIRKRKQDISWDSITDQYLRIYEEML